MTEDEKAIMIFRSTTRAEDALDEFCIKFTEICSFKEDQNGDRVCKWCGYYIEKMPTEMKEAFNEGLPERIVEKGFGRCKKAYKMAIKAGVENPYANAIAIVNNGVCSMFKASILKAIFCKDKRNAENYKKN
jgi:hypothetical protein